MAKMISIDGLTGSGKTTIADKIAEHMNKNGSELTIMFQIPQSKL